MFQGDECSRGMSVLGDGCLGGWDFHNSVEKHGIDNIISNLQNKKRMLSKQKVNKEAKTFTFGNKTISSLPLPDLTFRVMAYRVMVFR